MQKQSALTLRQALGCAAIFGARRAAEDVAASTSFTASAADLGIPQTFNQDQAKWILALHKLATHDKERALQILRDFAPARCSEAQATCVEELLSLNDRHMRATLVDAMEDCELRSRLRAQLDFLSY